MAGDRVLHVILLRGACWGFERVPEPLAALSQPLRSVKRSKRGPERGLSLLIKCISGVLSTRRSKSCFLTLSQCHAAAHGRHFGDPARTARSSMSLSIRGCCGNGGHTYAIQLSGKLSVSHSQRKPQCMMGQIGTQPIPCKAK